MRSKADNSEYALSLGIDVGTCKVMFKQYMEARLELPV